MNSKTYTGYLPEKSPDFSASPPSIARRIGGDGPILDITSTAITCNLNAAPIKDGSVSRVGTVNAGSAITFDWKGWPHSGPILTYMAKCEPNCGSFTGSTGKVWFKIDESGYENGSWASQKLYDQGNIWKSTVPACLADGEYLVRHEIIALSDCSKIGKCQFYPSCAQVKVVGGKGVSPSSEYLVAFPGGYSKTEPGILWDTNTQAPEGYRPPGPKKWVCPK